MKTFFLIMTFLLCQLVQAQVQFEGPANALISDVMGQYSQGKFGNALEKLDELKRTSLPQKEMGFVEFWRAMCLKKLMRYSEALIAFGEAKKLGHVANDFAYEFAQTAYASEDFELAEREFKESIVVGFKTAVSRYYIASMGLEQDRLDQAEEQVDLILLARDPESKAIHQPAEMLKGDILLKRMLKREHTRDEIGDIIIPQYRKAIAVDKKSEIVAVANEKIRKLQQDYRLVLFQLINGKPAINPRHVLKLMQEFSHDSNVTFSPAETTISKSKQESFYSKTDILARYTIYYRNYLSITPGLRYNRTYYFNRTPEIYRNDNQYFSPGLSMAYEHSLWEKPAATLFDYDYADIKRDVHSKKRLDFSAKTHTITMGERFQFFRFGQSTARAKWRQLDSYQSTSSSKAIGVSFEQQFSFKDQLVVLMTSYDRTRVNTALYDTDALLVRGDYFGSSYRGWVTPSAGMGVTFTDPINNRAARGTEMMINPSARLSHSPASGMKVSLKGDYQKNISRDKENFAYTKFIWGLEVEYLF